MAGRVVPPPRPAHSGRAAVSFARSANSFCSVRYFAPAVFAAALRFHATPLVFLSAVAISAGNSRKGLSALFADKFQTLGESERAVCECR